MVFKKEIEEDSEFLDETANIKEDIKTTINFTKSIKLTLRKSK